MLKMPLNKTINQCSRSDLELHIVISDRRIFLGELDACYITSIQNRISVWIKTSKTITRFVVCGKIHWKIDIRND